MLDIGLRSVKLKTWDGIYATIPNRKVCSEVLRYSFWFSTDAGVFWITLRGKLMQAIVEEFRKRKISIPFPQVTLSSREGEKRRTKPKAA